MSSKRKITTVAAAAAASSVPHKKHIKLDPKKKKQEAEAEEEEDVKICDICESEDPECKVHDGEKVMVCFDCSSTCIVCGDQSDEHIPIDELSGERFCQSCLDERAENEDPECSLCNETDPDGDMGVEGGEPICNRCLYTCDDCGEVSGTPTKSAGNGGRRCSSCMNTCQKCQKVFKDEQLVEHKISERKDKSYILQVMCKTCDKICDECDKSSDDIVSSGTSSDRVCKKCAVICSFCRGPANSYAASWITNKLKKGEHCGVACEACSLHRQLFKIAKDTADAAGEVHDPKTETWCSGCGQKGKILDLQFQPSGFVVGPYCGLCARICGSCHITADAPIECVARQRTCEDCKQKKQQKKKQLN